VIVGALPPPPPPPPPFTYSVVATALPASPLVDEATAITVTITNGSYAIATPGDLAVTVRGASSGLSPRVLTGKIVAGASSTTIQGARIDMVGPFGLVVDVQGIQATPTLNVLPRTFTGSTATEVQIDAGGPGIPGTSRGVVAALDTEVVCAFCDARSGNSHVQVNPSLDGGSTWKGPRQADTAPATVDAWDPAVAVDGGSTVLAAWCDQRALGNGAIYANVSTDGGQTFAAQDVRVDAAAGRAAICSSTRAAIAGGNLYVAWLDNRNASIGGMIYVAQSSNGGQSWTETRLDAHASGPWTVRDLTLTAVGADVSVAWVEQIAGTTNVVVASSQNGGGGFANTIVNAAPSANVFDGKLVASGGVLHAAWRDDRAGPATQAFTRYSADGGATWVGEVQVPLGALKLQVRSLGISASGPNVQITAATQDQGGTALVPVIATSTNFGASFQFSGALPQGTSDSVRLPRTAAQGPAVYASWNEIVYGSGERGALSQTAGASFATASKVSGSSTSDGAFFPDRSVLATGTRFYVVWEESRGTPSTASHLYMVVAQ
jgi:hypothetical protein